MDAIDRQLTRLITAILICSAGMSPTVAQPTESQPQYPSATLEEESDRLVNTTVTRIPGTKTIKVTTQFDFPHTSEYIRVYIPEHATLKDSDNEFEEIENGDGNLRKLKLSGLTYSPELTYTINITKQNARYGELGAGETWMMTKTPPLIVLWRPAGTDETHQIDPFTSTTPGRAQATAPNGVIGDHVMLLGEYRKYTASGDTHTFTIVTPTAAEHPPNKSLALKTLTRFDNRTEFGDADHVYFFISPSEGRSGFAYFNGNAVVGSKTSVTGGSNIFIHEFIHTQQDLRFTDKTLWIKEAFAQYISIKTAYQQGTAVKSGIKWQFNQRGTGVLNNPDTWGESIQYDRGARVLAVLDLRIHEATDGRKSIEDVFEKLNRQPGKVTQPRFIEAVNSVATVRQTTLIQNAVSTNSPTRVNVETWTETYQRPERKFMNQSVTVAPVPRTDVVPPKPGAEPPPNSESEPEDVQTPISRKNTTELLQTQLKGFPKHLQRIDWGLPTSNSGAGHSQV